MSSAMRTRSTVGGKPRLEGGRWPNSGSAPRRPPTVAWARLAGPTAAWCAGLRPGRPEDLPLVVSVRPVPLASGGFSFAFQHAVGTHAGGSAGATGGLTTASFDAARGRYVVPCDGQYNVTVWVEQLPAADAGVFLSLALVDSVCGETCYVHIGPSRGHVPASSGTGVAGDGALVASNPAASAGGNLGTPFFTGCMCAAPATGDAGGASFSPRAGTSRSLLAGGGPDIPADAGCRAHLAEAEGGSGICGFEGGLYHLRRGDVLYIRAAAAEGAGCAELGLAVQRLAVRWRVELAMRKRKREFRVADADESAGVGGPAGVTAGPQPTVSAEMGMEMCMPRGDGFQGYGAEHLRDACAAVGARSRAETCRGGVAGARRDADGRSESILGAVGGATRRLQPLQPSRARRAVEKAAHGRGLRVEGAAAPAGTCGVGDGDGEHGGIGDGGHGGTHGKGGGGGEGDGGQLSSIGSDTEWSEGFSSDDDARRRSRPPRHLRALARQAREVHLASSGD